MSKARKSYAPKAIFFDGLSPRAIQFLGGMFAVSPPTSERQRYRKIISEFTGNEFTPVEDSRPKFIATQKQMADIFHVCERTARRVTRELKDKNKIEVIRKPGNKNTYYLNWYPIK